MSEPGGGAPAGRRSLLGDADRERLVALLREHYAAGRLDLDDLEAGVMLLQNTLQVPERLVGATTEQSVVRLIEGHLGALAA